MELDSIVQGNQLPTAAGSSNPQNVSKDAFLQLMVLQMRNQDPLNPLDNEAMLSQMAQFSSLEQMSNLNDNFEAANATSSFMEATRLLGKEVELFDPNASPDNPQTLTTVVKSVTSTANGPLLRLENGMETTIDQVLKVSEPSAS